MAHVSSTTSKLDTVAVQFGLCPQVKFRLTRGDYIEKYKPRSKQGAKLYASDLCNVLLSELVDEIETVCGLSVEYQPFVPARSKSRGRPAFVELSPDRPQMRSVCGTEFILTTSHHNKLCLLRGILRELIPSGGSALGSPLSSTVRLALFLCFVLFLLVALFSVQDGLVSRVLRSLESTTTTCGSDEDEDVEVSSANLKLPPQAPPSKGGWAWYTQCSYAQVIQWVSAVDLAHWSSTLSPIVGSC